LALGAVKEGSEPYRLGFRSGDLLLEINGTKVDSLQKFSDYLVVQPKEVRKQQFVVIRNQVKIKIAVRQRLEKVLKIDN